MNKVILKLALLFLLVNPTLAQESIVAKNIEHSTSFVVQPQDTNHNYPMLFGGKTLAEMDRCAGITTRRLLYNSPTGAKDAVTIAINYVKFIKRAEVKDLLFISGKVIKLGEKSITIKIKMERETKNGRELLSEAEYVFVAYNIEEKKAIPHGLILE